MTEVNEDKVSFDDELLVLVNQHDDVVGYRQKLEAHLGEGVLHRAFSVFLFDSQDRLLLQQRSPQKLLWPGYWTNTCCSHPRKGESYEVATSRRTREELGVSASLFKLYQFTYSAQFGDIGSENELCTVFVGRLGPGSIVKPNPNEVSAIDWIHAEEIDRRINTHPEAFTPWFKLEWRQMRTVRRLRLAQLLKKADLEIVADLDRQPQTDPAVAING